MTSVAALCLSLVAVVPAQHGATPPAGGSTTTMVTQLREVRPDGSVRPLAGVDAWLTAGMTRPGPHGAQTTTMARLRATSDASGTLRFTDVAVLAGVRYRITVTFQGVTTRSDEFTAGTPPPRELLVHHVTTARDSLALACHWTVDVGEAFLRVTQVVRVRNSGSMTVDVGHSPRGLRMPTLAFPIQGRVPTWGLVPPGKVHGSPQPSTGQGHLLGEDGAMVFRGPIPPGGGLFFQFRYNIPYAAENMELAAVSELPIEDAAVTFQHTGLVHPRIRLLGEHRAIRTARDNLVRHDLITGAAVPAGQPVRIAIDRLPVQTKVPRWLATAGIALGLFLFAGFLAGAIHRSEVS